MNRTLEMVRATASKAAEQEREAEQARRARLSEQAEAAQEIIRAFGDLQDQFVQVSVLKRIWPMDYQRRDDRLKGLLTRVLTEEGEPYGIELEVPGGHMRFTVQRMDEGTMRFSATRDSGSVRPQVMDFVERQDWLAFFYRTMAQIIDL
jgi:hypothetical protein